MDGLRIISAHTAILETTGHKLQVTPGGVAVFPNPRPTLSAGAWYADRQHPFPDELTALIHGVLKCGAPIQPLMDWVIEYAPRELAMMMEQVQAELLELARRGG